MLTVPRPDLRRADPGALEQVACARCDQVFLIDQPTTYVRSRGLDGWVHESCPAATEIRLGRDRDRDVETVTWTRRALPAPTPPTSPLTAPEIQVARAMIAICASHPDSPATVVEVAEVAWEVVIARLAGRLPAADRHGLPVRARALLAEPGSAQDRLLGHWERRRRGGRVWYPGVAGLEPREAEVVGLAMDEYDPWDIRRRMEPRRDGDQVALDSVYAWLSEGRRKLRALFEMPGEEDRRGQRV